MNEKPIEWFTTLGEGILHRIAFWVCLVAMIVAFFFAFLTLAALLLIPAGVFTVLFLLLFFFRYKEYAFVLIGDDMRVSTVYNKNRRRKKMEFSLSQVERMERGVSSYGKMVYLCRRRHKENLYTVIVHQGQDRTALVMEPDPEFVELMKRKRLLQ